MPTTTSTRSTTDTENAVARTATEDKLWAALRAHPDGATCADLATAAGIGRSTAAKILARWADDGSAARAATPATGGSGRTPERWTVPDLAPPDEDGARSDPVGDDTTDSGGDTTPTTETASAGPDDVADPTDGVTKGDSDDTTPMGATDSEPDNAVEGPQPPPADVAGPGSAEAASVAVAATVDGAQPKGKRLPAGGLRGMVEDYLRERPGDAFGPSQIGKDLGRSSGAVANALEKLVEAGCVVLVQDKPRRYGLAPSEATPTVVGPDISEIATS